MNRIRAIWSRLRSIGRNAVVKNEIDEELRSHIDRAAAENIAAGMSPEQADRAARKSFGNFQTARERCRDARGATFGEAVFQDICFGARLLRKNPSFTAVAVLTLALGIGATTAIYSVVNTVLLNPIPGPHPERLVQIAEELYTRGQFEDQANKPFWVGVSPPVLEALLAESNFFSNIAWYQEGYQGRETADFVEETRCGMASANFFKVLNIPPLLGRTFASDEAVPLDAENVPAKDTSAVLSYSMWQKLFGGDRNVIGKTLELSSRHFTVVGVMPAWFQPAGASPICWLPIEPEHPRPNLITGPNTRLIARLRPETSEAQAKAMLDTIAGRLKKDYPANVRFGYGRDWSKRLHGFGLWMRPLSAGFQDSSGSQDLRRTLFGLLAAIVFVLLIVCANIANLTLARAERRQHELAIRASIGAGRGRLMRQLLTESLMLSCLGGLAGVVASFWGMKVLLALVPVWMPRLHSVQIDGRMLACTLAASLATGLLFGLVPAWRAGRTDLGDALKQSGAGATSGVGRGLYRGALVMAEVGLALVLLAGAGLMIESVARMLRVDPGLDPENLLYVDLRLPWKTYNEAGNKANNAAQLRRVLYAQMQERLSALPGVRAVGMIKHGAWPEKLKVDGQGEEVQLVRDGCSVGTDDLFRALRIRLEAGRVFEPADMEPAAGTVIINESMARALWPGEDAVGKKFGGDTSYGKQTYTVVGVVGDVRDYSFTQELRPTFYRPVDELRLEGGVPYLVIRTQADPRSLIPAIRRELKGAEPAMNMPGISIMTERLYGSTQAQRTYMLYLVVFAGVGVLLSAIGVYGVLAYSVARRGREIGIRIAVGAQRGDIARMIIVEGMRLVIAGAIAGVLAAFWLTRLLQSQLFQVKPADPLVMGAALLLLLVAALLACYLPARRAAAVDPMVSLRNE